MTYPNVISLPSRAELFYKQVLKVLHKSDLPFLIGGSLAMAHYMHLPRKPKDLDIFIRREDCQAILTALEEAGLRTEVLHPHWLAKAWHQDIFIDFIFSSGNGVAQVDATWFHNANKARLFGVPVKVCSPEDIVWSKAFIMDRQRFDGADIAHMIRDSGGDINWEQLVQRFGEHWKLLLTHLLLVQFVYPTEKIIPHTLMRDLLERAQQENEFARELSRLCQGTLLSRDQYLSDIELHGYSDGRVEPHGRMTVDEVDEYTTYIRAEQARLEEEHEQAEASYQQEKDGADRAEQKQSKDASADGEAA